MMTTSSPSTERLAAIRLDRRLDVAGARPGYLAVAGNGAHVRLSSEGSGCSTPCGPAVAVPESPDSVLYVGIASLWECAIKSSIGKLDVPEDFHRIVSSDYEVLGVDVAHVEACAKLPMHHRDPFDRMLVAQARLGGLVLVTRDRNVAKYDVPFVTA